MAGRCGCGGVSRLDLGLGGGTNAPCHGNTAGVSVHHEHTIRSCKIVLLLWNDFFANTTGATDQATQLVKDLVTGPFMNGLVQYGVDRGGIETTLVIDSSGKHSPAQSKWDVHDSSDGDQLVAFLNDASLSLPNPAVDEASRLYVMLLPSQLALTNGKKDDGSDNTDVCGWHHSRKFNSSSQSNDLFWCVIRTDKAPTSSTSSVHDFLNSIAYCLGHEIAEAVTNRDDDGWHGDDGNDCEIGDLCETNATFSYQAAPAAATWDVEPYWSQWTNNCIQGNQPVSMRAFLAAIGFDAESGGLRALGTPVINLSYMASRL